MQQIFCYILLLYCIGQSQKYFLPISLEIRLLKDILKISQNV